MFNPEGEMVTKYRKVGQQLFHVSHVVHVICNGDLVLMILRLSSEPLVSHISTVPLYTRLAIELYGND